MRVWITTVGTSPFAVFNSLWMAIAGDSYYPDKVYLLWNDKVKGNMEKVRAYIEALAKAYGRTIAIDDTHKVDEEDFRTFTKTLAEIIKREKLEGNEVAIDMTPGRKFMSAFSMYAGIEGVEGGKFKADRVYYLHLRDLSYMNLPLYLIPFSIQELLEMKSELGGKERTKEPLRIEGEKEEVKVTREELMAVINQEFLLGRESFKVKILNKEVATISLRENENVATVSVVKNLSLPSYMGDYGLFNSVLNASGIRELKATLDGEKWMGEEELYRWLLSKIREKETQYITFDTNSLIFGIPQRFLEFLDRQRDKAYSLNLAISRIVEIELTREKAKILKDGRFFDEYVPDSDYWNQPSPKDRLFKLGQLQLRFLNERNAILIEPTREGRGDDVILESFVEFLRKNEGELIVFTSDKNFFGNLRHLRDITPIYVGFGEIRKHVRWENFRDFIFASAVVFGKVSVSGIGEVKAVWRGKNPWEWDRVKVSLKPEARKAIEVIRTVKA
ncbi:hypothetical protein [Thermococcus barophilus]|uniref:Uncharacterized protein n=1 Tax=Thermococcus barophilus TaxID=55802 RepID=A0A0S1XEY3_THEBA|nr:hypothetical protein [Thermococcus barophilus]ALM76270.1 hypothetical protein TBCH5v1_2377 [Thermococcus barophilus]